MIDSNFETRSTTEKKAGGPWKQTARLQLNSRRAQDMVQRN